jgi:hypothetical protein
MKTEASTTTEAAAVAEQAAPVAPEQAPSTKTTKAKKNAPKGQKAAKVTKPVAKPAAKKAAKKEAKPASKKAAKSEAAVPREFSKKAIVIEMMRRKEGATLAEIAKATDWQNHSIRGFISGGLTKKMGLKVESTKNDAGERTYRIAK